MDEQFNFSNSNITELEYIPPPMYVQMIFVLVYGLVVLVAVGGNVLVCHIILICQRMRTATNLFLLNLAISDILMAILCIPLTFVSTVMLNYWPFGNVMCPVVTYIQAVSVFLSAFTLVAMSMDRYVAVLHPLRPKLTNTQAVKIIAVTWVLAMAAPLPTAIVSRVLNEKSDGNESDAFNGLCQEIWEHDYQRQSYSMVIMFLQYFIPLIVLIFTYARIGYIVWIKSPPGEAVRNRDERMAASKRKMVKMMIAMVVIYALSWLPLHAITLIGDQYPDIYSEDYMNIVWIAAHWTAMSHSCYNPIVYFSMNSKFRAGFLRIFKCCPRMKQEQLINESSKSYYHGTTCNTSVNMTSTPHKRNVITNYYDRNNHENIESSVV
ncbi:RYamide receptor [Octopus bimaculoides]|nr:RYamide receptor [Octopus bimaculoides]XP_052829255.1 RYamide receptor [Octopus bimaculoides]XP_052829256.1 RYamide receptor [Octopus bimaculoides]XP_052829257.1 RYamide receptor [Octopus bimaculoides]|eukprot:XP_014786450.1 PREDICTED: neuropeptide Y receptor-like [Octopus bimaculoides]